MKIKNLETKHKQYNAQALSDTIYIYILKFKIHIKYNTLTCNHPCLNKASIKGKSCL